MLSSLRTRAAVLFLFVVVPACGQDGGSLSSTDTPNGGIQTTGGNPGDGNASGGAGRGGHSASGGTGTVQSGGVGAQNGTGGSKGGGQNAGSGGGGDSPGCSSDASSAYSGTPAVIPGRLEAEDFDIDGYSDSTPGNEGGSYRTDVDVDIKELDDGYAVGWMTSGEWLEYVVNVERSGDYVVTILASSVESGRTLELSSCGNILVQVDVPVVADWESTGEVETTVRLDRGLSVLRVTVGSSDDVDLDAMVFSQAEEGGTGGTGSGGASGSGGSDSGGTGGEPGEIPRFVGNITTFNSVDTEGLVFSDYWDQITPENAGKWGSVQGTVGSAPDWSTLDGIYDYARENGIVFKQHAFVWGSQQPSGAIGEADVRNWMSTFCERYPATRLIDVVNEPPPHTTPSYTDAIGGGTNGNWQWITNSFLWAREACPNAILILNDFNNIEWSNDNQHFINIVNTVLENGGPIDAVGAQAHDLDNGAVSFQTVSNLLNKLHEDTGLPVYITEMDMSYTNDQQQLQAYQQYFPFFWEQDFIPGITIWGWIYGRTWNAAPDSGLVRDGQSRSAMTWLMGELGRPSP